MIKCDLYISVYNLNYYTTSVYKLNEKLLYKYFQENEIYAIFKSFQISYKSKIIVLAILHPKKNNFVIHGIL